jgi:hypothetical protein
MMKEIKEAVENFFGTIIFFWGLVANFVTGGEYLQKRDRECCHNEEPKYKRNILS